MSLIAGIASGVLGGTLAKMSKESAAQSITNARNDAGLASVMQGANAPLPRQFGPVAELFPTSIASVMDESVNAFKEALPKSVATAATSRMDRALGPSAAQKGRDNRAYLQGSFPELNPWELSGSSATGAGTAHAEQSQAVTMKNREMDNQQDIVDKQLENQRKIAGMQSYVSRMNTKDQVYANNEMLRFNQRKAEAEILKIKADTSLSHQERQNRIAQVGQIYANTVESYARAANAGMDTAVKYNLFNREDDIRENMQADTEFKEAQSEYRFDENEREWREQYTKPVDGVDPFEMFSGKSKWLKRMMKKGGPIAH